MKASRYVTFTEVEHSSKFLTKVGKTGATSNKVWILLIEVTCTLLRSGGNATLQQSLLRSEFLLWTMIGTFIYHATAYVWSAAVDGVLIILVFPVRFLPASVVFAFAIRNVFSVHRPNFWSLITGVRRGAGKLCAIVRQIPGFHLIH